MPSSFSSTAAAPSLPTASATEEALWASIGRTGRPTVSRNRSRAPGPSASRPSATVCSGAREHHRPPYVSGRRAGRRQALDGGRVQGALPDLSGEQPDRKRCSSSVAAPISSPT